MTTFFPHLYEYCKVISLLEENKKSGNEIQKRGRKRFPNVSHRCPQETKITKCFLTFNQDKESKNIDFLKYLEIKAQNLRESTYNPLKFYNVTIETILKTRTELSNINKYEKPFNWPLSYEQLIQTKSLEIKHWIVIDIILCIEIAKTLPFFCKLSVPDQQTLLRTTTLLTTCLTEAYYSYVASSDVLIFPDGFAPTMSPAFLTSHNDFFIGVVEPLKRIKMTKEEYILLKTIIFCSSKSDEISEEGKEILEKEFHRYSRLLLNYIQAKHGNAPGAVRYSQILSVMEAMIYFSQKGKEFYAYISTIKQPPPHPTMALLDQVII
jgi:hypothetical protein